MNKDKKVQLNISPDSIAQIDKKRAHNIDLKIFNYVIKPNTVSLFTNSQFLVVIVIRCSASSRKPIVIVLFFFFLFFSGLS